MPKAILEFNLPEEREEHELALNAHQYMRIIEEMDDFLREKIKYEQLPPYDEKIYRDIRNKLWELRRGE